MKKLLLLILFLSTFNNNIFAQGVDNTVFIHKNFENAKVFLKNNSLTISPMNYDADKKRMCFKENDIIMELTNVLAIDSIIWNHNGRKFITDKGRFLEEVKVNNGTVYIDWKLKKVNIGSRGALGLTTQTKVEAVSLKSIGIYSSDDDYNHIDIYEQKNDNNYFIEINGKLEKVKTIKQLSKLYPQYKELIETYTKDKAIDMKNTTSALALLDFTLSLTK